MSVLPLHPPDDQLADLTGEQIADLLVGRLPHYRGYISPSQLKMADRCPEQFRRHYILGEKQRPGAALVAGSADHAAIEYNYAQKVASREDIPTGDVQTIFASELDKKIEEEGGVTEIDWEKPVDGVPVTMTAADARKRAGVVKDDGVRLVSLYHDHVSPVVQPLQVEREFEVQVPGIAVPIKGAIDVVGLVADDPVEQMAAMLSGREPEGTGRILERKRTTRNAVVGEWLVQGRVYQLVVHVLDEQALPVDYQLSVQTKKGTQSIRAGEHLYDPMPPVAVVAKIRRTLAQLAQYYALYGPDQPWPDAMTHTWACDFCGFRPTCPWWQADRWQVKP